MRIISKPADISTFLELLRRRASGEDGNVLETVREVLDRVRKEGDGAVREYTLRFDKVAIKSPAFSPKEIAAAASKADPAVVSALKKAAARIRRFHEMQREKTWTMKNSDAILGQIVRPLRRVGIYVPGGKASYPSTVLMNVIPAQVAGVKQIALCVPAPRGEVNPHVMAAIRLLGVTEVYRIGGAQAVAALAYGTRTIERVDKIVGPGNIYVATAKRMVFGTVDIDMVAGPSEILIIADRTANPAFIAADMLGQAEHDELASAVLVTDSGELAGKVASEIDARCGLLARSATAAAALKKYGAIIRVKSLKEAAAISNRIAPEHLEVITAKPFGLLPLLENAGAIFLGPWTPEALGDYAAGPNHTLPTGGTARFSSPLGTYDFYKRSSLLSFTKNGFLSLANIVTSVADAEGLEAHAGSVRVRAGSLRGRQ